MWIRMVDTGEPLNVTPAKAQELMARGQAVPVDEVPPETAARTQRPVPAMRPDVEHRG